MSPKQKSQAIVLIEKLRLIESEIFRLSAKHGIKTIDDLDRLVTSGQLSEMDLGDDLYFMDYLLSEKNILLKKLRQIPVERKAIWKSFQNLLELPRLSFPM